MTSNSRPTTPPRKGQKWNNQRKMQLLKNQICTLIILLSEIEHPFLRELKTPFYFQVQHLTTRQVQTTASSPFFRKCPVRVIVCTVTPSPCYSPKVNPVQIFKLPSKKKKTSRNTQITKKCYISCRFSVFCYFDYISPQPGKNALFL